MRVGQTPFVARTAGYSSGANLAAALALLDGPLPDATVAIIACDSGLKYLSTDLWK